MAPQPISGEMHSKPPRPASMVQWIQGLMQPFLIFFMLLVHGLPGAVWIQIRHPSPINWINPFHWQQLILSKGFGAVLKVSDVIYANLKRPLLGSAYGRVLEVGAGSGANIPYYDVDKIERLYCLEPYAPLRDELTKVVEKAGLTFKTTIIPAGLDKTSRPILLTSGIEPGSIDTIVLFQVMCSIGEPKAHLDFLQSLLKPGGQILIFEHVASKQQPARMLQNIYTPVWKRLFGGCEMNRDSADWIRNLGGWDKVEIQRPVVETTADLIPHAIGRFVKAK